ncbi:MAG TPA: cytochrome c [Alphaproteobacteria bacterium]
MKTDLNRRCLAAALSLLLAASAAPACADEAAAAKGARLYENYCSTCHGEELQNNSAGLTFDLRRLKPDDHGRFVNSVLNGKNRMPPWKGVLDEAQIELLWSYIRSNVAP